MEKETEPQQCLECQEKIIGRSDKKFCDDTCRTSFNNKKRQVAAAGEPEFLKAIPRIILENYAILKKLNSAPRTQVSRSALQQLHFNFSYFTSTYTTRAGDIYHFCFDQGYLCVGQERYLLVQQQSQVQY